MLTQVRTRKGNFYSVRIDHTASGQTPPLSDLLCVPRGLLKKIKQKVLVGDKVKVVGIDWPDAQGMSCRLTSLSHVSSAIAWRISFFLLIILAQNFQDEGSREYKGDQYC